MLICRTESPVRRFMSETDVVFAENTGLPKCLSGYDGRYWLPSTKGVEALQHLYATVATTDLSFENEPAYLRLGFELMEDQVSPSSPERVVWGWCFADFCPGSTLWGWIDALLYDGHGIKDDVKELDISELVGRVCELHLFPNGALEVTPMPSLEVRAQRALLQLYLANTTVVQNRAQHSSTSRETDGSEERSAAEELTLAMCRAAQDWKQKTVKNWIEDNVHSGCVHPKRAERIFWGDVCQAASRLRQGDG